MYLFEGFHEFRYVFAISCSLPCIDFVCLIISLVKIVHQKMQNKKLHQCTICGHLNYFENSGEDVFLIYTRVHRILDQSESYHSCLETRDATEAESNEILVNILFKCV